MSLYHQENMEVIFYVLSSEERILMWTQFCPNGRFLLLLWFIITVTTGRWSALFGFGCEKLGFALDSV